MRVLAVRDYALGLDLMLLRTAGSGGTGDWFGPDARPAGGGTAVAEGSLWTGRSTCVPLLPRVRRGEGAGDIGRHHLPISGWFWPSERTAAGPNQKHSWAESGTAGAAAVCPPWWPGLTRWS